MWPRAVAGISLFALQCNCDDDGSLIQLNTVRDQTSYESFVSLHGLDYTEHEYAQRKSIYERRLEEIKKHNSNPHRLWNAGINHMADWTDEEFQAVRGWRGGAPTSGGEKTASFLETARGNETIKDHMWNATFIGLASNQGSCGSCWAVATANMVKANHRIHTGEARSFSAQELVNCVANPQGCGGSGGCKGATVELAMAHVMEHGLSTLEAVPYVAKNQACAAPSLLQRNAESSEIIKYAGMTLSELTSVGVKHVQGAAAQAINLQYWERLPVNSGSALQQRLLQGTVAVSVMASTWMFYENGIFDKCDPNAVIDHAVLAVGFGIDGDKKYWTIQNSWSPFWGEVGRIRLLRTEDDYCGWDTQPEIGTGCKGGPSAVKVCGMCGLYYDNVFAHFGRAASA